MSDVVAPVAPVVTPAAPAAQPVTKGPVVEVKPQLPKPVEPEAVEDYEIDGKKVSLTKTQARTYIQKAGAVDKRFQQVSEKEKQLDALLKSFDEDPEAALAKLGKDPKKIIQEMLARSAKLELMTPEQKERHALEQERDKYKSRVEAEEKARTDAQQAELDKRNFAALETQLLSAAQSNNLDQTPETLELMCDIALEAINLGMPITPNQVAQEVILRQREHLEARDKKILSKLDDSKLVAYLGPDIIKRIQKASLALVPSPAAKTKTGPAKLPPRAEGGKFMRESDFDKKFGFRR